MTAAALTAANRACSRAPQDGDHRRVHGHRHGTPFDEDFYSSTTWDALRALNAGAGVRSAVWSHALAGVSGSGAHLGCHLRARASRELDSAARRAGFTVLLPRQPVAILVTAARGSSARGIHCPRTDCSTAARVVRPCGRPTSRRRAGKIV